MVFRSRERDDGNFELALDAEGIDWLEKGLAELRYMGTGEALATPSVTTEGVGEFLLKRVKDGTEEPWERRAQ
jgi:hypothetical protein